MSTEINQQTEVTPRSILSGNSLSTFFCAAVGSTRRSGFSSMDEIEAIWALKQKQMIESYGQHTDIGREVKHGCHTPHRCSDTGF